MKALKSIFSMFGRSALGFGGTDNVPEDGEVGARNGACCPMYLVMEDACMSAWLHRSSLASSVGEYEYWLLAREMNSWAMY